MNKQVTAVVVTYKRKDLLIQVIHALLGQSYKIDKILVIDNNSCDGTSEIVRPLLSNVVAYHNTGSNLGGAGGFHHGFLQAEKHDYDFLWLMDDDFRPEPDCLEKMLAREPVGIVQPIRYNLDGSCAELSPLTYDLRSPFKISPKGISVKQYISLNGPLTAPIDIEAIAFEGPLIPRSVVQIVGLPQPRYFIFCDDIEYAVRAKRLNISIMCDPSARATRLLVNNQRNDLLSWKGYFMLRNLFYLHRKFGENLLVRKKPLVLALGYALSCVLKRQFKQLNIIYHAYKDSSELKNTERFKPD